jgi:hypothetical protein
MKNSYCDHRNFECEPGSTFYYIVQRFLDTTTPSSQAALAQAKGNPGDQSSEFQTNQGFRNSGCYKDTESRALPSLEGKNVRCSNEH